MAKMSFEFDTETKQMSASIDGKAVPNVAVVQAYPSYSDEGDEYTCSFMTRYKDETTGITETRHICASAAPLAVESEEFPGFYELRDGAETKFELDVADCFGVR